MRRSLKCTWLLPLIALSGCGDNISNVMRDFYNTQHEVLDNMVKITDEDSAKAYNEFYKSRLSARETAVKERKDKLERTLFTEADRKIYAMTLEDLQTNILKGQITSLDNRILMMQNRLRRLIVRLTEEKAAELKRQDKTFTVDAGAIWPELTNPQFPTAFGADPAGGGQGDQGKPAVPQLPAAAKQNLTFSMTCEKVGNGWNETRRWRPANKLEVNGIDLTPLTP